MKKVINAIIIGTTVKISIDGKLQEKNCGTIKEANELFKITLAAKADPSDENIKKIRMFINEKIRVAYLAGLECDPDNGEVFLAGFNTPIPEALVEVIRDYVENDYPLNAIVNFWKLLMINPDHRVRTSLFDFIVKHDFVLTDNGYMVVYKAVNIKKEVESDFSAFISNQFLHVKKDWGCSPNKYIVYRNIDNPKELAITKFSTAFNWKEKEKGVEIIGKLGDLYVSLLL
jgi:hypothetical protein